MYENDALLALGFKRNEKPSEKEIKKAYKIKALKYHPDKLVIPNGATEKEIKKLQDEQKADFELISTAYDCLLHPEKKEHRKGGGERGPMTVDEYLERQYGCRYKRQVYGDESKKYYISFTSYDLTNNSYLTPQDYGSGVFYFDSMQELKQFFFFLKDKQCFKISLSSKSFPKETSSLIVDAIEQNRHIMEAKIFEDFLSPEQTQRLKDVIYEKNYPTRLKKSQEQVLEDITGKASILGALLAPLSAVAISSVTPYSLLSFGFSGYGLFGIGSICAIGGYFLGSALGQLRCKYLNYSVQQCYANVDTPDTSKDSEIEALKIGVEAKSWTGYFSSYTNYAANRHPLFFAAGLKVALDEDEKALPKLKTL